MTCYVLTLLHERFKSSDKDIDVEINGETKKLYWRHSIKYYNGWLIYEHEPNVKYPAYETWDEWCPIHNNISVYGFNTKKIRQVPFDTLEELKDYVVNVLPKIVKEESFKY